MPLERTSIIIPAVGLALFLRRAWWRWVLDHPDSYLITQQPDSP